MKFTVNRTELLTAAQNAERIAPRVSTIEILQCAYLQAEQDTLTVASGNLEIALEQQLPAQIETEGRVVVKAPLLSGMLRLLDGERVTFQMKNGKLVVSSGNAEYAIPVMDAEQYDAAGLPVRCGIGKQSAGYVRSAVGLRRSAKRRGKAGEGLRAGQPSDAHARCAAL